MLGITVLGIDDTAWTDKRPSTPLQLALATFGILALELALIRWASGQVRALAYFNNLILIGAFLGMGLGVAVGRRRGGLVHLTLPVLALLAAVLCFSEPLGIMHLRFPDDAVVLWGAGAEDFTLFLYARNLLVFMAIFSAIVAVFFFAGGAVGQLFGKLPTLKAYTADLGGSLLGVLAVTAVTFLDTGPAVWVAVGALPFAWLSRRALSWAALAAVVALAAVSAEGAIFSPYNRIDLEERQGSTMVTVNRDFHQYMHDLSDEAIAAAGPATADGRRAQLFRRAYDLPFVVTDARERALIVGAGTGNDAQAALRAGFQEVVAVDIDGRIVEVGERLHPEAPYSDPRVSAVVTDARAFFEQYRGEPFDVVCYGLLDSHAMFTSLSSLRLDNYVYTAEGIRTAWEHVDDDGLLSVSFSVFAGRWLVDRLAETIATATGRQPLILYHGMHYGVTFLVARDPARLHPERVPHFRRMEPPERPQEVRITTDDWPFLYVRPGVFPWGYLLVLGGVLAIALVATPRAFGRQMLAGGFDPALFFMGGAFLLVETRGVTTLSLLFGSTWMVNSSIFAGVLAMVLLANLYVERYRPQRLRPWFALLLLSVVMLWLIDYSTLNQLPLALRWVLGGLSHALPIGFAGVIVSTLLARSAQPTASLGSNLLGSVVGGCLEYLSMLLGLRAMALLALLLYLAALWFCERRGAAAGQAAVAP